MIEDHDQTRLSYFAPAVRPEGSARIATLLLLFWSLVGGLVLMGVVQLVQLAT